MVTFFIPNDNPNEMIRVESTENVNGQQSTPVNVVKRFINNVESPPCCSSNQETPNRRSTSFEVKAFRISSKTLT